jgi:hypothetical protein
MNPRMAARVRTDQSEPRIKQQYQVRNWAEYDRALVSRGKLTICFDEASIA